MDHRPLNIRNSEVRLFLALGAVLLTLFLVSFIFGLRSQRKDNSVPSEVASGPFESISLGAKAVFIYDIRSKRILFARNENVRLPLASLAKIMSALVAEDLSSPNDIITVSKEALSAEGDSGLRTDEKWSLGNILDFSLVSSSNDAMRAVALAVGALSKEGHSSEEIINDFVIEMNRKASELGLKNTYFWNETGLDESFIRGGGYSTAQDISSLLEYVLAHHPDMLVATRDAMTTIQSLDRHAHVAQNTNTIVAQIPGLLASKTGFTNVAGGNMVVAFDPELGRPIIIVVLGSTEDGRFEDVRALVNATLEYIKGN